MRQATLKQASKKSLTRQTIASKRSFRRRWSEIHEGIELAFRPEFTGRTVRA